MPVLPSISLPIHLGLIERHGQNTLLQGLSPSTCILMWCFPSVVALGALQWCPGLSVMPDRVYANANSCAKSAADYNITLGWPEANGKKALSYQKQRHEAEVELGRKAWDRPRSFCIRFVYVPFWTAEWSSNMCAQCFYANINTNGNWKGSLIQFSVDYTE